MLNISTCIKFILSFLLYIQYVYSQSAMTGTLTFLPDTMPEVLADPQLKVISNIPFPGVDSINTINWITRPDGRYEYYAQYQLGSFGLQFEPLTLAQVAEYNLNKTITFQVAYPGKANELLLSSDKTTAFKNYCKDKMLFGGRNGGTYSVKLQNSEDSGCASTMLAFCAPGAPDWCPLQRYYVNSRKSTTSTRFPMSAIGLMSYYEGQPILNAFEAYNNISINITIFDATGPNDILDEGERQFLLEFGRSNYVPIDSQMGGTDQLNDYTEKAIARTIINGTAIQLGSVDNSTHRHPCRSNPRTFINYNTGYPIYNRIQGLFCKNGHVYRLGLSRNYMKGTLPASFKNMKWLEALDLYNNYMTGDLPDMTGMNNLKSILIFGNSFTSVHPSLSTLTNLEFLGLSFNKFTSNALPDLSQLTKLKYFVCSRCNLAVFPNMYTSVTFVDLSDNKFNMPLTPSIVNTSFSNLKTLDLGFNKFFGTLPSTFFDNFTSLEQISLRQNNLTGLLPSFAGTKIKNIELGDNKFLDDVTWNGINNPYLQTVNISNNKLTGPFDLRPFAYLTDFDISYNTVNPFNANRFITFSSSQRAAFYNSSLWNTKLQSGCTYLGTSSCKITHFDAWKVMTRLTGTGINNCFYVFPASIVNINMAYNQFTGPYTSTMFVSSLNLLNRLELQGNLITTIPNDIWGTVTTKYTYLDFSNNKLNMLIRYVTTDNFRSNVVFSFIPNNLNSTSMITDGIPPSTMTTVKFDNNPLFGINLDGSPSTLPDWVVQSSVYINIDKFSCPQLVGSVNPLLTMSLDPQYYGYKGCVCARGYYGNPPNCNNIPPVVQGTNKDFSDYDYGNDKNIRLMPGIDITWVIVPDTPNTKTIQIVVEKYSDFDVLSGEYSNFPNKLAIQTICPAGSNFNFKNKDCSCASGTYYNIDSQVCESYTDIPVKQQSMTILSNDSTSSLSSYQIVNNFATVNFQSKKLSGKHFHLNYTVSTLCPEGYLYYEHISNSFLITSRCEPVFELNANISYAVFAVAAFFGILLVAVTAIVVKKRNTMIIKSSSFPFCFIMLVFMTIMCVGGVFYAISPKYFPGVCHCRAWFTAFPLTVILSALLVKADRIRKIFASKELVVQAISNAQLAKVMSIMLCGETGILLWFSIGKVSIAQISLGSGSTANMLINSCTDSTSAWIGIQFAYILSFLFAGVVEAWGVRKVPSAFNEGPHIASTLLSLTVLLVILIPVQFMISDNPDALMVIRGVGQILVSAVMAFFLFGPKLYYILEGKENDKSLTSIGSSKSSSSSSSFSSSTSSSKGEGSNNLNPNILLLFKEVSKSLGELKEGVKNIDGINRAFDNLRKGSSNQSDINMISSEIDNIKKYINA